MGSIIQSIPLLQGLKNQYPDTRIVFATTKANVITVKSLYPLVDDCYLLDDSSFLKLPVSVSLFLWKLIRFRPQVFIDLEIYSNASSLLTTLSLATNRIGYYLRSEQYRKGLYSHMLFFNTNTPIQENYKQTGRLLGITDFKATSKINLMKQGAPIIDGAYIIINPNASDLRLERRWPPDNYVTLIKHLLQKYNYQIILIGAPFEASFVEEMISKIPVHTNLINMAGQSSLEELFNIVYHAKLVITNDSGPMHLAFLFNKPTVALFGPCHPAHYGIESDQVSIHYANTYCSPCVHEFEEAPCKGDNQCMQLIPTNQVIESAELLINGQTKNYISLPVVYSLDEALGVVRRS
jgi:ADP-heptose:LPS heptosyltransferase